MDDAGGTYGRSNLLCDIPGSASATGAPPFVLGLRSNFAGMAWGALQAGEKIAIEAHPLDGSPVRRHFPQFSDSFSEQTNGIATCYLLFRYAQPPGGGTTILGNSEALCVVPGFGTLPD